MIGGIEKEKFVYIFKEIDNNFVSNANMEENKNIILNKNNINDTSINNNNKVISSPSNIKKLYCFEKMDFLFIK